MFGELGQVNVPDLERYGECEQLNTPLVHLEALLKVLILLEELCVIDNDLGIGNFELEDLVVCSLSGFNSPQGFLMVDVE